MDNDSLRALAGQAGANALPLFLALLFLMLILVTAGWWFFHGKRLSRMRGRAPDAVCLIYKVLGLIAVIGGALIFIAIADSITADSRITLIDATVTNSKRTHVPAVPLQIFAVVTHFGDRPVLFAIGGIAAVLLWRRHYRLLAVGLAVTLAGNAILNPMLKQFFARLRPLNEQGLAGEPGWSFPSGHASGAMVTYGMLAYVALKILPSVWHLPVVLGMISLVLTVGFSRIFLQVHFPSDVAAGFVSGLAWLSLCILSIELIERHSRTNASSP